MGLKKKFSGTTILLFWVQATLCQLPSAPNANNEDNQKQGQWIYWFDQEGIITTNEDSCRSYRVVHYESGMPTGYSKAYDLRGNLTWRGIFNLDNGEEKVDGEAVWFNESGAITTSVIYEMDEPWAYLEYDKNGSLINPEDLESYVRWAVYYADKYREAEWYPEASDIYARFLKEIMEAEEKSTRQWRYRQMATVFEKTGRHELVPELQRYIPGLSKEYGHWQTLFDYAYDTVYLKGAYIEALDLFREVTSQAVMEFGKAHQNYAESVNMMGVLNYALGRYDSAMKYYDEALTVWEKALGKRSRGYLKTLSNQAVTYQDMGGLERAEELYAEVSSLEKKILSETHPDRARTLHNLASLYLEKGDYLQAEKYFKESIDLKLLNEDLLGAANSYHNLGVNFIQYGNYEKAEINLNLARDLAIREFGPSHSLVMYIQLSLASVYKHQGKTDKGIAMEEDILSRCKLELGTHHPLYTLTLNNLAVSYIKEKEYLKGEQILLQSLANYRDAVGEMHPAYATVSQNLAALYHDMFRYDQAAATYLQVLDIQEKTLGRLHPSFIRTLNNLSDLYEDMGAYDRAIPLRREMIKNKINELEYNLLASSENEQRLYLEHNRLYFSNFQAFCYDMAKVRRPEMLIDLFNLQLHLKGYLLNGSQKMKDRILSSNDTEAREKYNNWLMKKEEIARYTAKSNAKRDSLAIDLPHLIEVADQLEKELHERSQTFRSKKEQLEVTWEDVRDQLKPGEAAVDLVRFTYSAKIEKKYKGFGFRVTGFPESFPFLNTVYYESKAYYSGLRYGDQIRSINGISLEFMTASEVVDLLEDRVTFEFHRSMHDSSFVLTLEKDSLSSFQEETIVVYLALIVTPETTNPVYVALENGHALENEFLKRYQNSIHYQLEDERSYEHYWGQIASKLKELKVKKTYFSPDGVYNQLNLNTLYNPKTNQYVEDEMEIHQLTNIKEVVSMKGSSNIPNSSAVLLGRPDYHLNGMKKSEVPDTVRDRSLRNLVLIDLPGTEEEVANIRQVLFRNNWDTEYLIGEHATEDLIKQRSNEGILHIATHGFFFHSVDSTSVDPMLRSGVLLAGAGANGDAMGEDGILTAYEASNLTLDETDLVVLSACETGLGDVQTGEGVYGLQRGFKAAGAGSILMSLWKVSDEATKTLMSNFYESWLAGGDKRQAFKTAKQQLREIYDHPYYWGAFVMIGD